MADFEQLKRKYQPVVDAIQKEGGRLENLNMEGQQLYLKATAPSDTSKNHIWDAIKSVDPSFSDLKHDIQVQPNQGTQTQGGQQTYTVKAGDNLSKISKHFYGDANKYTTIAKANNIEDPNKINVGQELIIPAA